MPLSHSRSALAALALFLLSAMTAAAASISSVGAVTWHPKSHVGKTVEVRGYVLAIEGGLVLFSDEATGAISSHDLPIAGPGADQLVLRGRYLLVGVFTKDGRPTANGSPYHLQLTATPTALGPK